MGKKNPTNKEVVLAIDTATAALVLSLGNSDEVLASHFTIAGRNHLEEHTPAIESLFNQAELDYSDLSAIITGRGPGSLIGARVGVMAAKTLAQALKIPLIGISTIDCIAHSDNEKSLKVAVIDALKSELFWAFYEDSKRTSDHRLGGFEEFESALAGRRVKIIGTAIQTYRKRFLALPHVKLGRTIYPSPDSMLKLGIDKLRKEHVSKLHELEPIYLRAPV